MSWLYSSSVRVGNGYDVHALKEGLSMWLCGVNIPSEKGFVAHSDGDVAIHALCDALLGAAALGDIGQHFPDSDPKYKDISSLILLKEAGELIGSKLYIVSNIDATVIAQRPKLASYIPQMRQNIADTLGIDIDCVNIKATTEEGLGFTGEGLGIAAQAVCLLENVADMTMETAAPALGCAGCRGTCPMRG